MFSGQDLSQIMSFYPVFQVIGTSGINTAVFALQYIDIAILS